GAGATVERATACGAATAAAGAHGDVGNTDSADARDRSALAAAASDALGQQSGSQPTRCKGFAFVTKHNLTTLAAWSSASSNTNRQAWSNGEGVAAIAAAPADAVGKHAHGLFTQCVDTSALCDIDQTSVAACSTLPSDGYQAGGFPSGTAAAPNTLRDQA